MSEFGSDVDFSIHIENDLDIDDDGISSIITYIYVGEDESSHEVRVELEDITDELCDLYGDINGYLHLYNIAHEFTRLSEKLREAAMRVEDSPGYIDDLFDISDD